MKRKHDALVGAQTRLGISAAQPSLAQAKTAQHLPGQDLLTESVFWSARRFAPNAKPRTVTPSLACRVKHLGSKGWGLIAKQHVRQGSVVLEYVGDLVSKAEAQQRIKEYEDDEIDSLYLLHLSPSSVIDATRKGNKARYMRHAADANCQAQKWIAADNRPRAFMVALRDIAAGEELTFNSYRQCSLGSHVRCMCSPVLCHSNQGTPVLQSQSETELMADAVLKCIQETNFGSLHDLQARNQQTTSRPHASTVHPSQQLSPSTLPPAFASPPPTTREDINALGLDSPDSFLDQLHKTSARPPSSLQAITSRCRSIIGQLADPLATTAGAQQPGGSASQPCEGPSCRARHGNSGAVLASSQDAAGSASDSLFAEGAQQQAQPGRLPPPTAQAQAARDSPARQVVQQLQSFLASRKHVIVGGYEVASQPGQLLKPAAAYKPMKALKMVLGPRLQAGNVTRLDVGVLLQEAGWPPHPQPSPTLIAPPASSLGSAAFPLKPPSAAASMPMQRPAAAASLLGTHLSGCMLPPAPVAVTGSHALTGNTASPSLACTSDAQQPQKSGQQYAPDDTVIGSQAPPNTPEQVQSCLASLGLTGAQIQACLENAQRIEACL